MRLSLLLAILPSVLGVPKAKRDAPAPLYMATDASDAIADKYIVKFKEDSSIASAGDRISILAESADYVYTGAAMDGFAGSLDADTLEELRANPDVEYIEQDATVSLSKIITQYRPAWGLARISDREIAMEEYSYDESAGQGTCVYVLDTGIDDTHPDFGGRAHQIKSFIRGQTTDGHGHGTHCAGVIGSASFGVAKKATIFGIKIFSDHSRTTRGRIIAGIDYTIKDAAKRAVQCPNGILASFSFGGAKSIAMNNATAKMVNNNIFVAIAAGNDNRDASADSPASEETACTVGAILQEDARARWSNFGSVVDIFAPGMEVMSTAPGGGYAVMSGTSSAAPHIAGLAAYLGALEKRTGGGLCDRIQELATRDVLRNIPEGTKNLLAFNNVPLD